MTHARVTPLAIWGLAVCACGPAEPRFGEVTVSAAAPSATLSGSTHATAPATELSPGCPGYLDPDAPEHIVRLADASAVVVTARSNQGPLALAVVGEGEVRCDSDGGAGHAPRVAIDRPGEYAIHVASLRQAQDLLYELAIGPAAAGDPTIATPGGDRVAVSVTITSDPPGATVRTAEGQVLGTTPAMFALQLTRQEIGQERRFILEMPGRAPAEVSGRMIGGAVVLHASLHGAPVGAPIAAHPGSAVATGPELVFSAANAQPIRDYQTARQSLEVDSDCTIVRASVDVNIQHTFIGDLQVTLRSPQGTSVLLHNHGGGGRANLVTSWDWSSRRGALQALAGQNARGRWEMAVRDDAGADIGTFRSFTLHLQCREGVASSTSSVSAEIPGRVVASGTGSESAARSGLDARQIPRPRPRVRPPHPDLIIPWNSLHQRPQPPLRPQPPPQTRRRNPGSAPGAASPHTLSPW